MSERYTLFHLRTLESYFSAISPADFNTKPRYNIAPTQSAPVVIQTNGQNSLQMMQWGLVPTGAKDTNAVFRYKTYNVKSETILRKHSTESLVRNQRCVIPSTGYYAWQNTPGGKMPYFVRPSDQELFGFAGVCTAWTDPEGNESGTYSIITTESVSELRHISDRMPVILPHGNIARWLGPDASDASTLYDIVRPYIEAPMIFYRVSDRVFSVKQDAPKLILEV